MSSRTARALPASSRVPTAVTATATLASGAVMMVGGYLFNTHGWGVAGPSMIPAGPLISIAFFFASRPEVRQGLDRKARARVALLALSGLPSSGGNIALPARLAVTAVTLLAGAVMAVAGYAIAAWSLYLVPPLVLSGGAVIGLAFLVAARAERALVAASQSRQIAETA